MLRWSINLFRVFGIQLAVHGSFLLLLAYAGVAGWQDGGGWSGAFASVLLVSLFFVCVILHELGHALTARRFGVRVPRILLLPIGGIAEFDRIPRQPAQELLITAAGPAVNFLLAGCLGLAAGLPPGWPLSAEFQDTVRGFAQLLMTWNLGMGLFNLLPIFPMDGGRILRALLAVKLPYLRATFWAALVGKVLSALLVFTLGSYVVLSWILWHGANLAAGNYTLLILFTFIFVVGDAEYRQVRRHEEAALAWAELSRRLAENPSHPSERRPPLILHGPN